MIQTRIKQSKHVV